MFEQAAGFALLAAVSPTALVVATVFLASAEPRRTFSFFLSGALAVTVVLGAVIFLALRAGGLQQVTEREPRYGLRLGLGLLALGASLVLARRGQRTADPRKKPNLVNRLLARPGPRAAFAVGLLVFFPSVAFVGAVQTLATAEESTDLIALAAVLVVTIVVMLAWLPLLAHLLAPNGTARTLKSIDGWLRLHGHTVVVAGTAVAGLALLVSGAIGLAG